MIMLFKVEFNFMKLLVNTRHCFFKRCKMIVVFVLSDNVNRVRSSDTRYNIFATGGAEYAKHLREAASGDYHGIRFA